MTQRMLPLAVLLLVPAIASAQAPPAPTPPTSAAAEPPTLVSYGEATVRRAPDRAWVHVSAESRARSPREAQKLNAGAMSLVLQKLRGLGLPDEALQTRGYDLQPEFDYANGRQTLRGYVARNSVEVRVDDLGRVGEILDVAVSSGATSVGGVRFDLKDRDAAQREALRMAVADARRRADAAAAGAGMKVERVARIEEHRPEVMPPPRPAVMAMREMAQDAGAPPIAAGELEIRAAVSLTVVIR